MGLGCLIPWGAWNHVAWALHSTLCSVLAASSRCCYARQYTQATTPSFQKPFYESSMSDGLNFYQLRIPQPRGASPFRKAGNRRDSAR